MFLIYQKSFFNLIPVCLTCCILFPSFLEQYQSSYLLLYVVAAFFYSKIIFCSNEVGEDISLIASWMKLLTLNTRLAIACFGLGHLLTEYHGVEEATYHLFPAIPWLMPATISLVLAALVALGLQPSTLLKSSFKITFLSLICTFFIFGMYRIISVDNKVVLSVKFDKMEEIPTGIIFFLQSFIKQTNVERFNEDVSTSHFLLLAVAVYTLSTFNEKMKCDGIISCMKSLQSWYEPVMLILTISSLGLCLPDLFFEVCYFLDNSRLLKKMITLTKYKYNNAITVGLVSTGLVYFCSLHDMIMISGSSFILYRAIEELRKLLITSHNNPFNVSTNHLSQEELNLEDSETEDDQTSVTESSSSDISLIVAEYKAQIKIMKGDLNNKESSTKRNLFVCRALVVVITILGLLLSYSVMSNQIVTATTAVIGLTILILLHQWTSCRYLKTHSDSQMNSLKAMISYITCIVALFGIPKIIWFYLIIWITKGVIIYIIYRHRHALNGGVRVKHILSIKDLPPVFKTSCGICELNMREL